MNLLLPFPPSANAYWRTFRGRVIESEVGRAYKAAVSDLWLGRVGRLQGHLLVAAQVAHPTWPGDLDNTEKVLLDALKGIAWDDDRQVAQIQWQKAICAEPHVRLEVLVGAELPVVSVPLFATTQGAQLWTLALAKIEAAKEKGRARARAKRAAKKLRLSAGSFAARLKSGVRR